MKNHSPDRLAISREEAARLVGFRIRGRDRTRTSNVEKTIHAPFSSVVENKRYVVMATRSQTP